MALSRAWDELPRRGGEAGRGQQCRGGFQSGGVPPTPWASHFPSLDLIFSFAKWDRPYATPEFQGSAGVSQWFHKCLTYFKPFIFKTVIKICTVRCVIYAHLAHWSQPPFCRPQTKPARSYFYIFQLHLKVSLVRKGLFSRAFFKFRPVCVYSYEIVLVRTFVPPLINAGQGSGHLLGRALTSQCNSAVTRQPTSFSAP